MIYRVKYKLDKDADIDKSINGAFKSLIVNNIDVFRKLFDIKITDENRSGDIVRFKVSLKPNIYFDSLNELKDLELISEYTNKDVYTFNAINGKVSNVFEFFIHIFYNKINKITDLMNEYNIKSFKNVNDFKIYKEHKQGNLINILVELDLKE